MIFNPSPLRSQKTNAAYKKHVKEKKPFVQGKLLKKGSGWEMRKAVFPYDKIAKQHHILWADKPLPMETLISILEDGYSGMMINSSKKKTVDTFHVHYLKY